MRLKEAAMKAWKITVRLSATLVLICCLAFGTQSAKAQNYTSDHDITHFTSGIVSYATFSNYSSSQGCPEGSTFTPTSSELNTTGCRVFGGMLTGSGLSAGNNWIEASFSSPVSTIVVFPNIDHFGSGYDGYQYTIAGSNDGVTWTVLFDATSVSSTGEPFTLGAFFGTAPTSVNNVLTPQSVGLPASCSGTLGTACSIGYIATFTFSTAYQFYAFGASTEAFSARNADQELSAVGAAQTVTQPVSTGQPTNFDFSSGGNVLTHVVDFSKSTLDYPTGINPNTVQIQSTNNPVDPATWPKYVVGGPFAPSTLFPLAEDNQGGGNNGGLFVDLCFDATQPSFATPSDANCPKAREGSPLLAISVTADLVSKPPIMPGTTTVLAHFEPNTSGQTTWSASNGAVNPACTNTTGTSSNPAPQNCDVLDIEQSISGDQTTSSGRSRGKGTFAFAYGVPMLLSTVLVNNTHVNTPPMQPPSPSPLWFKSPLTLSFTVNPASVPPTPNNNFVPAPVAGESFAIFPVNGPPVPLNPILPLPSTQAAVPVTFSPPQVSLSDGHYTLEWSAVDNVGIQEQNQQLVTTLTAECPNSPDSSTQCYVTSLFSAPLNVDSTAPTATIMFSPSSNGNIFAVNQQVTVSFACDDPLVNGVHSGIATCVSLGGQPSTGGPLTTSKAGTFTYTVTATDVAGNQTKQSVQYQIVGSSELVLLNLAKPTVNQGSNLTYNIAVLNFGPAVADNLVVTDTLPAGTSFVSAGYGIVSCMPGGCSDMNGPGTACSISGNTVTCNIPTLGLLFKSFTGALVKITVNVNSATPGTVLKDTATVRAVNTDPFLGDNSATARTEVCTSRGSCPDLH
jgi:uncharacterized repeat protein (TIGR01451 family)